MRHVWLPLALCALATTACTKQEVSCPSIYIGPHASIALSDPIAANGTFDVELTIDGKEQTCQLTITGMAPGKEECVGDSCTAQSPSTRTNMTCEGIDVSGINNDGSIPGFRLEGTPKAVAIRLVENKLVRAEDSFTLEYAPASLIGEGCPKTEHASATLAMRPPDASLEVEEKPDGSRTTPFDAARTYGGRISGPPSAHFVVRDDAAYDALIARIPKNKIQKKRPADPSDDALLGKPAVEFSAEMIVVAVCGTFYCPISLEHYRVEGDTLIVTYSAPGEDPGAAMGARPIGMNGEDVYGNYAAGVVPEHSGKVTFENASPAK